MELLALLLVLQILNKELTKVKLLIELMYFLKEAIGMVLGVHYKKGAIKMDAPKMNELQIRLLAMAQALDGVEVRGSENMKRIIGVIKELNQFAMDVAGKKLIDDADA